MLINTADIFKRRTTCFCNKNTQLHIPFCYTINREILITQSLYKSLSGIKQANLSSNDFVQCIFGGFFFFMIICYCIATLGKRCSTYKKKQVLINFIFINLAPFHFIMRNNYTDKTSEFEMWRKLNTRLAHTDIAVFYVPSGFTSAVAFSCHVIAATFTVAFADWSAVPSVCSRGTC